MLHWLDLLQSLSCVDKDAEDGFLYVFRSTDFLISLAMEFTIKETFSYFGRLLKLKPDLVASRQAELLKLLQLGEEEDRQVRGNYGNYFKSNYLDRARIS